MTKYYTQYECKNNIYNINQGTHSIKQDKQEKKIKKVCKRDKIYSGSATYAYIHLSSKRHLILSFGIHNPLSLSCRKETFTRITTVPFHQVVGLKIV